MRQVLGQECRIKGDEAVFFCPNHGHKKGRREGQLSVNLTSDKFHCWSCGFGHRSSIEPILRLKPNELLDEYRAEHRPKPAEVPERQYDTPVLPKEFRPLSEARRSPYYLRAMEYLAGRGVSSEDILVYKLGYCEDGDYKNRIIVPSFDQFGDLNFFTGRLFMGEDLASLKYKFGRFDKDIIFNDYLVDWSQPVTLVEGPFDAIKAGTQAVPLQGTSLRKDSKLFHRIVERQRRVNLALDNDARDQRERIAYDLLKYGVEVGIVSWGDAWKDPGELTKEQFSLQLSRAAVVNDPLVMLRLRLEHTLG